MMLSDYSLITPHAKMCTAEEWVLASIHTSLNEY